MLLICNFAAVVVVHWVTFTLCEAAYCPAEGYCFPRRGFVAVPDDIPPQASHIYLYGNDISSIKPGAFNNNTNCTEIRLEYNQLRAIRANTWEGLRELKYLKLGYNSIEVVEERAFSNLPSLEGLYLENNQLMSLSQGIFHPDHPSMLELILLDNPLNQNDQRLCWIQRGQTEGWITNTITQVQSLECPQTAKPEVQNTGPTGSARILGSGSSGVVTEDMPKEVKVGAAVTQEYSSHRRPEFAALETGSQGGEVQNTGRARIPGSGSRKVVTGDTPKEVKVGAAAVTQEYSNHHRPEFAALETGSQGGEGPNRGPTGSARILGSGSSGVVTEDTPKEVKVGAAAVTQEYSSHRPPESAALETGSQGDKTFLFLVIGSVCLSVVTIAVVTIATACSQCRRKVKIYDKEQRKSVTVEIEPQTQGIKDRPLPALPSCKATTLQPTAQPSTGHVYNANPCTAHSPTTQPSTSHHNSDLDSHGYLIPIADSMDLMAKSPFNEAPYSYTYQHRAARIKAFLKLQRQPRYGTASKDDHKPQRPLVRSSFDPKPDADSSVSTRLFSVESRERFSSADSDDYLLPVDTVTEREDDDCIIDPVYQRIK